MKLRYLSLLFPLLAIGCQSPVSVKLAQTYKAEALRNYLTNDARIDGVVAELWKASRDKQVKAKADSAALKVLDLIGKDRVAVDATGKPTGPAEKSLTGDEALQLATAIHAAIQNANAQTAGVLAKIKAVRDANVLNLTRYSDLEGALNDYLAAGIDEAVLSELTAYLIETIAAQAGKVE
jgi:hypothetical protein